MARRLHGAAVAVLVGGATVFLAACSGNDPQPFVSETPSRTAVVVTDSPSPTPTLTAEEKLLAQIPENARGEDFVSASNFAKFFILEYQAMFTKRDDSIFKLLSEPGCKFC